MVYESQAEERQMDFEQVKKVETLPVQICRVPEEDMVNSSPEKDEPEDEEAKYKPAPLMIKIAQKRPATPEPKADTPKEEEPEKQEELTEEQK